MSVEGTTIMKLTDDPRFESLKLIKDWSSWMVTTEGVMIGFLVNALAKTPPAADKVAASLQLDVDDLQRTILAFGVSIAMAAWVLGSLPSIAQRLRETTLPPGAHGIFDLLIVRLIPLYAITCLQHVFFIVGLVYLFLALPLSSAMRNGATARHAIIGVAIVLCVAALMVWWKNKLEKLMQHDVATNVTKGQSKNSQAV